MSNKKIQISISAGKIITVTLSQIVLIFMAILSIFPFVWMICSSFKSNTEIIKSSTEKIVVLPDAIRPSFLNDESDIRRIKEQEEKEKYWNEVEMKKPESERFHLSDG